MITREEAEGLRDRLLAVLEEDAHNTQRLVARLDAIGRESGVGAHAALLLILTHLSFEEEEARRHWEAILRHREELSTALARDAGLRVAVLDYFVNVNRRLTQPTLIDLDMVEATPAAGGEDRLTGLAGARAFRAAVQGELRRARRYEQRASIALFDLDDFAERNARLGPLVCDRLLRETAIALTNNCRDIDFAARPGEDEFAVLLPETDRNGALLVAERFRHEVEAYFARREAAGAPVGLTVSAGVASYPDDATAPEDLLARAAQALYRAKASGKNQVCPFRPERRRFLRFDLEPGRFEVEVLGAPAPGPAAACNLSRNGILFTSPAPLQVGERIELRLADAEPGARSLRMRGQVVRLEELPEPEAAGARRDAGGEGPPLLDDRFEIGVAFDLDWAEGTEDLLDFLERAQSRRPGRRR